MKRCNDGKKISGLFVRMRDMMEWRRRRVRRRLFSWSYLKTWWALCEEYPELLLKLADGGLTNKGIRWLVVRRRLSTFDDV